MEHAPLFYAIQIPIVTIGLIKQRIQQHIVGTGLLDGPAVSSPDENNVGRKRNIVSSGGALFLFRQEKYPKEADSREALERDNLSNCLLV